MRFGSRAGLWFVALSGPACLAVAGVSGSWFWPWDAAAVLLAFGAGTVLARSKPCR